MADTPWLNGRHVVFGKVRQWGTDWGAPILPKPEHSVASSIPDPGPWQYLSECCPPLLLIVYQRLCWLTGCHCSDWRNFISHTRLHGPGLLPHACLPSSQYAAHTSNIVTVPWVQVLEGMDLVNKLQVGYKLGCTEHYA